MKINVTFKTPDAQEDAIDEIAHMDDDEDICYDEQLKARATLSKFIRYGEYITVEFDTETQTARVVE